MLRTNFNLRDRLDKNVENINEICKRYANALILSSEDKNELK